MSNIDMQRLITCTKCEKIPHHPPLYNCKEGHIICEYCLFDCSSGISKKFSCHACGTDTVSRNIFGEELLKSVYNSHNNQMEVDVKYKDSIKQNTNKSILDKNSSSQLSLKLAHSLANTSRRPIFCPNTECNKMIAITQLITHFQFEHAKIPMTYLEFNEPKTLMLSLNSMDYGKSHCIALLIIMHEKGISDTISLNTLAFPLLAAKLRCKPESKSIKTTEDDDKIDSEDLQMDYSDVVVIWICGNINHNIKCMIEVSDEKQTRIYSYYGCVNSLREQNDAKSVFLRADCLLLHSSNIQRITQNGEYPMDLKVLINCPL